MKWTEMQRCFAEHITNECFGYVDGDALAAIIPLLRKLNDKNASARPGVGQGAHSLA